jgi:hypothetical protein
VDDQPIQTEIFDPDDVGISDVETAKILHVKPQTLATWRSEGRGPWFFKVGRAIQYTPRSIREFRESCARVPEPAATRRRRRALAQEG